MSEGMDRAPPLLGACSRSVNTLLLGGCYHVEVPVGSFAPQFVIMRRATHVDLCIFGLDALRQRGRRVHGALDRQRPAARRPRPVI